MTDYRTLCAELLDNLERYQSWYIEDNGYGFDDLEALLRRADAALAQPEPQRPTVMEIIELHTWMEDEWRTNNDGEDLPIVDFARAVLTRWGRPTIEPVPQQGAE
jgi:hypothetical protein